MVIKHKNIKRCKMIMQSLAKDHNILPGTMFSFECKKVFRRYNVSTNDKNVVVEYPQKHYCSNYLVPENELLMFVDVVFDPYAANHFVRFLHKNQKIAIIFKKGKTIKLLKTKVVCFVGERNDKS